MTDPRLLAALGDTALFLPNQPQGVDGAFQAMGATNYTQTQSPDRGIPISSALEAAFSSRDPNQRLLAQKFIADNALKKHGTISPNIRPMVQEYLASRPELAKFLLEGPAPESSFRTSLR